MTQRKTPRSLQAAIVTAPLWMTTLASVAGALTDGTVGAVQNLSGRFTVPQSLGSVRGTNLFHSFARFGIASTESATFSADPSIRNVISRVSGSEATLIDGTLKVQGAGRPDFYFVNPNGITVGGNASIDVPAGLHLSTAPQLKFADGFVWQANGASSSSFTVAAPTSFGFLPAQAARDLRLTNASLDLSARSLELVGGNVLLSGADVQGQRIRIQAQQAVSMTDSVLYASAETGRAMVEVDARSMTIKGAKEGFSVGSYASPAATGADIDLRIQGPVLMTEGALVAIISNAPIPTGRLRVAAETLDIGNGLATGLITQTLAEGPAPDIQIEVGGALRVQGGGLILSQTLAAGATGDIMVRAGSLLVDGTLADSSIRTLANRGTSGRAGSIALDVRGPLSLLGRDTNGDNAIVAAHSQGEGSAGDVRVKAGSVLVDRQSAVIASYNNAAGSSGAVALDVEGLVHLRNGGKVNSTANGLFASAGDVTVSSSRVLLESKGNISSLGTGSGTNAGTVRVTASERLDLYGGSLIVAHALGTGSPGQIEVRAPTVLIEDTVTKSGSSIGGFTAGSPVTGRTGSSVKVDAAHIDIREGGRITAATFSNADAGSIRISTDTLTIDGGGKIETPTGVIADSGGDGRGGRIDVQANSVLVTNQGAISASAGAGGQGGSIRLETGSLMLEHGGSISSIATKTGSAGDIDIAVRGSMVLSSGGGVSGNSGGSARAGNIRISADSLSIGGVDPATGFKSRIVSIAVANTAAQPGNISLDVKQGLELRDNAVISIGNFAEVPNPLAHSPTALTIRAGHLNASNGEISAEAAGNAGAGRIALTTTGGLRLVGSAIKTLAVDGNGGPIDIQAGGQVLLRDAQITTSVSGARSGNGGDIRIGSNAMLMQSGFVQANTAAPLALGGQVVIDTRALVPDGANLFVGGSRIEAVRTGVPGFNVIQAAAPDGLAGQLDVTLPQLNLSGSLAGLSTQRVNLGPLGQDMCRIGQDSSLTRLGHGSSSLPAEAPLLLAPR